MKVSVTFLDQPSTEHSLRVEKQLGADKFAVYHVYSSSHKANYALKVFPKTTFGTQQYEKEQILSRLSHPNVIQNVPIACDAENFHAILTEFAKYGDLLNLATNCDLKSEILVRTYFRQLIEGLEHIHSKGIAHLDLKLENLVLATGFTMKIIDFDQAQPITDKQITSAGTQGYRAPEIIEATCEDLAAADIYSAGIILFILKMKEFPFAEVSDETGVSLHHYLSFMKDNSKFWKMKGSSLSESELPGEDFISLVNGMLQYDPQKRFTIQEIKNSKWFNGPILSKENLNTEMRVEWNKLMKQQAKKEQVYY